MSGSVSAVTSASTSAVADRVVVNVNFRADKRDKIAAERVCRELGLTMSSALNAFIKYVGREERIPFALSLKPEVAYPAEVGYSPDLVRELRQASADYRAGRLETITLDELEKSLGVDD